MRKTMMIRGAMVGVMLAGISAMGLVRTTEPTPARADDPVIVTAPDGTVTVNQPQDDGTVKGSVTTPDGETFTFPEETPAEPAETPAEAVTEPTPTPDPTPAPVPAAEPTTEPEVVQEDDPRWDCRSMGNRTCGVTMGGADYLITFDEAGDPIRIEYAGAPEWGYYSVNPPVFGN